LYPKEMSDRAFINKLTKEAIEANKIATLENIIKYARNFDINYALEVAENSQMEEIVEYLENLIMEDKR
jgi:hypothetical protein